MSKVMVIAGEVSGDQRAAELIEAANAIAPGVTWFGIGGPRMRAAGVDTRYDVKDMAVIGFAEVLRRYPFFRRAFKDMLAWAAAEKPDLALFVDYPGFNLRLAEKLHAQGIRTLFYICPQVWAWHRSRIPAMARYLDHLISIFPFEARHFDGTGLPVSFVGHPLVDSIQAALSGFAVPIPWKGLQRIALLPGSRTAEIRRLLPVMLEAAVILDQKIPGCSFIVAAPGAMQASLAESICHARNTPRQLSVIADMTYEIVRQADAAMVCSGTATVETALLGCPMAIVYKLNPASYYLLKSMIRIPNIGMVNVVAGREICPELVQGKATPANLATALEPLITQTPVRTAMLKELRLFREQMGEGGAAARAATILVRMLDHA
jgi:lipid-A-disaccharide synthase